ncbi:MAG: SDR family NAD(P)-dependent oxidoreductase [Thermoplasmata archaeon]
MTASSPASMEGRVVVITGGTSGIGLETARGVASRRAHVVLVGRGDPRVHEVAAELARSTGNPRVEGLPVADLALRSEWMRVGQELLSRYPAIHVLINNAGAFFARKETTDDGVERTFALNVLAPLGLTTLLADRLRSSAPARVVNVASAAHRGQTVELGDLEGATQFRGYRAYGRSKLEVILLSRELGRRFTGTGVTVNSLHPGFIRSGFARNNGGGVALAVRFFALIGGRSVQVGARTSVRVACDPDLASVTGQYFSAGRVVSGSAASQDAAMAKRLYEACLPYLKLPPLPEPTPAPIAGPPTPGRLGSPATG